MKNVLTTASTLLLCALPALCSAAKHPVNDIADGVLSFIESELLDAGAEDFTVEKPSIDPRLYLEECLLPIEYFTNTNLDNRSHVTVGVRCSQPNDGWTIYVNTGVSSYKEIYIASREIQRGDTITEADIVLRRIESSQIRGGTLDDPLDIVGSRAKRRINDGNPLLSKHICVICKGEQISIVAANLSGSLRLSMNGQALTDGAVGDLIRVRNTKTNRIIEAKISAPGEVLIVI